MPIPATLLEEALEGWRFVREGLIDELENIPAESFDFAPAPGARSIAEVAVHIVESGLMMSGELSRADGDFTRRPAPALMAEYALAEPVHAREPLIDLLRRTHLDGTTALREAGEIHMLQQIVQFNGVPATRLSWMSHGVSHEDYHRGQIALYARLLGIVPALTKRIHGEGS